MLSAATRLISKSFYILLILLIHALYIKKESIKSDVLTSYSLFAYSTLSFLLSNIYNYILDAWTMPWKIKWLNFKNQTNNVHTVYHFENNATFERDKFPKVYTEN